MLLAFLLLLGHLVTVFADLNDAADRRDGVRRNLDQIHAMLAGKLETRRSTSKAETNLLPRADAPAAHENFAGVSAQPGPTTCSAAAIVQPAPVIVATSNAIDAFDSIPRPLCWGLLGISALIFLIQIWNYALS